MGQRSLCSFSRVESLWATAQTLEQIGSEVREEIFGKGGRKHHEAVAEGYQERTDISDIGGLGGRTQAAIVC